MSMGFSPTPFATVKYCSELYAYLPSWYYFQNMVNPTNALGGKQIKVVNHDEWLDVQSTNSIYGSS